MTEIQAVWWTLTYVILPAISGGYVLTLCVAKWLHHIMSKRMDRVVENEIRHLANRVRLLEDHR